MSSLETLLISLPYERAEKQIVETVILTALVFSFNSDKLSTSFSFICHTSNKATCLSSCPKMSEICNFVCKTEYT